MADFTSSTTLPHQKYIMKNHSPQLICKEIFPISVKIILKGYEYIVLKSIGFNLLIYPCFCDTVNL